VARADRSWAAQVEPKLRDLGEVDGVSILPLVERLTVDGRGLIGEPGLSYLVQTDRTRLLFDTGLSGSRIRSALANNANALKIDLGQLDAVVISHLHLDHVGGPAAMRRRTFAFAAEPLEPRGVPAHVLTDMRHPRADIIPTLGAQVVAPGMAVLPPLPRMLSWIGYVTEQALVVNVRGFGLVLISGCGHPPIERMLGVTEQVLDVPIRAVVGDCTCPSTRSARPWCTRPSSAIRTRPGSRSARRTPTMSSTRSPPGVRGSSRCPVTTAAPWTYDAFGRHFGHRYRTMRASDELRINAGTSSARH
jgi:7,8-dihydropterin-6-yl-methyl-4-(beta-D-ribofuranosyl)aminobenzene 5'-phosphate synthase